MRGRTKNLILAVAAATFGASQIGCSVEKEPIVEFNRPEYVAPIEDLDRPSDDYYLGVHLGITKREWRNLIEDVRKYVGTGRVVKVDHRMRKEHTGLEYDRINTDYEYHLYKLCESHVRQETNWMSPIPNSAPNYDDIGDIPRKLSADSGVVYNHNLLMQIIVSLDDVPIDPQLQKSIDIAESFEKQLKADLRKNYGLFWRISAKQDYDVFQAQYRYIEDYVHANIPDADVSTVNAWNKEVRGISNTPFYGVGDY
ncbi:MAG: hypothetical protein ACTSW1_15340 [Candidatus Hodarchaeales archaeon]